MTVTTMLIGTRMSVIFQESYIRVRAVGNVPSNFQMCLDRKKADKRWGDSSWNPQAKPCFLLIFIPRPHLQLLLSAL